MNQTNLNTELLAGESRTRKHVPVAVFAVIFIHIVLFLLLLIAAGCRARARAAELLGPPIPPAAELAQAQLEPAGIDTPSLPEGEMVVATEPRLEQEPPAEFATPAEDAVIIDYLPASSDKIYVVKPGDSLWLIARKHGTTVNALKTLNNLKDDRLKTGQQLKVDSSTSLRAQKT